MSWSEAHYGVYSVVTTCLWCWHIHIRWHHKSFQLHWMYIQTKNLSILIQEFGDEKNNSLHFWNFSAKKIFFPTIYWLISGVNIDAPKIWQHRFYTLHKQTSQQTRIFMDTSPVSVCVRACARIFVYWCVYFFPHQMYSRHSIKMI